MPNFEGYQIALRFVIQLKGVLEVLTKNGRISKWPLFKAACLRNLLANIASFRLSRKTYLG
jgi:hypothetical protein